MSLATRIAATMRNTPFHPQWLLGPRQVPRGIEAVRGRLLDIGAAGRWLEPHVPAGVHYIAVDYPATGRDMYQAAPDIFADGACLPLADASVDAVACLEVLEHVREPQAMLAEIARVLRPGGHAWISVPFLYPVHDAPHDYQRYTLHGLRLAVEKAGLQVAAVERTGSAVVNAGLLASLAIAGGVAGRKGATRLLLPVAAVLVLAVNCSAWLLARAWPAWPAMCRGHDLEARKP